MHTWFPILVLCVPLLATGCKKECKTDVDCDDGSVCTTDVCGADHTCTNDAISIDDSDACTTDACDPTAGITHTPLAGIDDSDICTDDACDTGTGAITHTPLAGIDDSDACTNDGCTQDTGVYHDLLPGIDDSVACTDDTCDTGSGDIAHTQNNDHCAAADGASCTVPTCDPSANGADSATGCLEVADDSLCNDSQTCTTSDTCDPTANGADGTTGCVYVTDDGACDDGLACTTDACAPFRGCSHTPDHSLCGQREYCDTTTGCGVPSTHLVINEIDYDNVGSDDNEFVEIYNGTGAAVDLTNLALVLVNGSSSALSEYLRADLVGASSDDMLPDDSYLVVASGTVVADANAYTVLWPGDDGTGSSNKIQNGHPDGLALIDTANLKVIDSLSYEEDTDPSMIAVSIEGFSDPVDLVEGDPLTTSLAADSNSIQGSLIRSPNGTDTDNAASDWIFSGQPTPGAANVLPQVTVTAVTPDNGLATTSSDVVLTGTGFAEGNVVVSFGVLTGTCTWVSSTEVDCTVPDNQGTPARVDVTVTQSGYDGAAVLANGWTWTGATTDVDYCTVQFPKDFTGDDAQPLTVGDTATVYGQIYESGLTDATSDPASGIVGDLGVSAADATGDAADPTLDTTWTWIIASPNAVYDFSQSNDEYQADTTPEAAGTYRYAYRFSLDDGLNFTYCDADDTNGGFDPASIGTMTVNAP